MKTERDFYLLALMVATVQGASGAQPVAVRQHDPQGTIVGVFWLLLNLRKIRRDPGTCRIRVASRTTGSSRSAILSVIVFFIAGAIVLSFVNVKEGQAAVQN